MSGLSLVEKNLYRQYYKQRTPVLLQEHFDNLPYKNKLLDVNLSAAEYTETQHIAAVDLYNKLNEDFCFDAFNLIKKETIYGDIQKFIKSIEEQICNEYNTCIGYFN